MTYGADTIPRGDPCKQVQEIVHVLIWSAGRGDRSLSRQSEMKKTVSPVPRSGTGASAGYN